MYFIVLDRVAKILKCGTIGLGFDPFICTNVLGTYEGRNYREDRFGYKFIEKGVIEEDMGDLSTISWTVFDGNLLFYLQLFKGCIEQF